MKVSYTYFELLKGVLCKSIERCRFVYVILHTVIAIQRHYVQLNMSTLFALPIGAKMQVSANIFTKTWSI